MNLWHIQLHPTGAADWTVEDTRRIVATGYIGCSGKAVQTFEKLLVGDLVLVRYGAQVVALVAVEDMPRLLLIMKNTPCTGLLMVVGLSPLPTMTT